MIDEQSNSTTFWKIVNKLKDALADVTHLHLLYLNALKIL